MQHIVKNNDLRVSCNAKLLENVQASSSICLSRGGCCTVALSKHLNGFITPQSLVKSGCGTIIVADNANESGSKMFQIPITGNRMISFLDSNNKIVVLAVGKTNIQVAISTSSFSMEHDLVFERLNDVFKLGVITEIDDVKYRRIPLDMGGYVDKLLVADKKKKVYTLEYDSSKSTFVQKKEVRCMEKIMDDNGLWALYTSFIGENPEYTPADFIYYSNSTNMCYIASDSIMNQDESHIDKNDMGFSHVNCIEPYGVYNPRTMQTECLLYAAKMKDKPKHRIYLQYAGFNTDVDDAIKDNPETDIYDIVALPACDRNVSIVCAIGEDGDKKNVLYTGVIPNDYDIYKKNGMVRELSPIYSGVLAAFPCQAFDNILTGFIVLDNGTLVRFIYSLSDDSIITRPVEIETCNNDNALPTFNCYHTQLDLSTASGVPLPSGNITITSPYTCLFEIMGKRYAVKENHPLEITDVVSPTLYITQYVDEIYASEFNVRFHTKDIDGKEMSISCTINPSAENEDKISSMSSDDWCTAVKQDGSPLIPTEFTQDKGNMDVLAKAISNITTATSCPTIKVEDSVTARKLSAENITEFALCFDKNQITYTENNIHQLYLTLKAECRDGSQLTSIFGWAKKQLSSVIKAASEQIIDITKVIVTKVDDAFHTVVEFFKDGVCYIVEEILDFVSKAYDTVTTIFTRLSVYFQDFMEWLGQLLHWNEIKENAALIKKTFYKYFDLWQSNVCNSVSVVQNGIDKLTDCFQSGLTAIEEKYGDVTLRDILDKINGNSTKKKIGQNMDDAVSNNIFMEKLLCETMSENTVVHQDNISDIVQKIVQSVEKAITGISEPTQKFIECFNSTDILDIKLSVFIEYFKSISNVPAQMANDLLDIVKDLISSIFQAIKDCLEAKIDIPFFSWLFSKISDMECNIINIISLIIAVPYSAVEKIFDVGRTLTEKKDISPTSEKILAITCAVLLPVQKFIDETYTAVSAIGVNCPIFRLLNGLVAVVCDTISVMAWTIMIVGKTSKDALQTTSRVCYCCCAFLMSLIDFALAFISTNKVNAIVAAAGGIIMLAMGVASCTCYAVSEGGLRWNDNAPYDSASIVASGGGNLCSLFFIKSVTGPISAVVVAIGIELKRFFNIAAVGLCWFSTGLTLGQSGDDDSNKQLIVQFG